MEIDRFVTECTGFDWDESNIHKNWDKHQVSWWECEEVFVNEPILFLKDPVHLQGEKRYYALGMTAEKRRLFVSFTIRHKKIRPISVRDMSRKERRIYEEPQAEADSAI